MLSYRSDLVGVDWEALKHDLIADGFHNGRTTDQLQLSFEHSAFVAMAFDGGRCIATGRVLSDGVGNGVLTTAVENKTLAGPKKPQWRAR